MVVRRTASSVLSSLVLLGIVLLAGIALRSSQGSQNKRSLDLSGKWETEDGRQVIIEQAGSHVHAIFGPEDDQCTNGATIEYLLEADLSGVKPETEADYPKTQASLSGKMAACTAPELLAQCPNLSKVWKTTFDATAAPDVISGDAFIEGIDQTCNTNHKFDTHQAFTLTACEDVSIMPGDPVTTPDSNTKVRVRVTCSGAPVEGAKVDFEIEPQDSSGGHIHVEKRPKGKLNGEDLTDDNPTITLATDSNGEVNGSKGVTFAPPGKKPKTRCVGIAGDYKITAKSHRVPDHMDHTMIWVGYQNLTSLTPGQYYDICADSTNPNGCTIPGPWGTTEHPDSENGTANTLSVFQTVAKDFYDHERDHNQQLHNSCNLPPWPMYEVSFNDIALPWGGLFDSNSTWTNPHQTHGKGEGGDFNHFGANVNKQDCKDTKLPNGTIIHTIVGTNVDTWLWETLEEMGEWNNGLWDESDLNANPPRWHLHVDDAGVEAPAACPADN